MNTHEFSLCGDAHLAPHHHRWQQPHCDAEGCGLPPSAEVHNIAAEPHSQVSADVATERPWSWKCVDDNRVSLYREGTLFLWAISDQSGAWFGGETDTVLSALNSYHSQVETINKLAKALCGLKRINAFCWCLTWTGGEHEPECIAATNAIALAER